MTTSRSALPAAVGLGLFALLPCVAGVYYAWHGEGQAARQALSWLLPYLAVIVGFIGGAQWGRMLSQPGPPALDMALAVLPAILAWGALLTGAPWRTLLLLLALIAAWLIDEHGAMRGWQHRGFLQLRRVLTFIVTLCVVAIGWRIVRA